MRHIPELDALTARFSDGPLEPLRVTVHLQANSHIVNYDPLHLDGLLARAVVELATEGRLLADCEEGYWIPLPLRMLWQDPVGYPLWAASILYPVSPHVEDIYVRHKRNSEGWLHNKPRLVTRNGPWMERRMPTPTQVCDVYEARCIGHKEAVANLLATFTHIGKLRLGRVKRIEVEMAEFEGHDVYEDAGTLIKPLPAASELLSPWPGRPSLLGWTPPHWKPSLFRLGWRVGTTIDTDWFAAASELSTP